MSLFPCWEHAALRHAGHRAKRACQLPGQAPEAKVSLERWHAIVRAAQWTSTDEVQKAAPKAKVLNRERVRFEVAGGNYRLVAAFDFRRQIAFVKFIGTHAEYDRIDALNVSQF
jgi:mRNA interferase HigB